MQDKMQSYDLWSLVIINSVIFIIFAFSFTRPSTSRDWRSFGAFAAFIVALFTEMYGFPLTIYLLSGWLGSSFKGVDLLSHDAGHLWHTLFGIEGNPHFDLFHILSYVYIILGFFLLSSAWRVLYKAQKGGTLATEGIYSRIRHPQYLGFISIMIGFLLQWPTLPTLIMFPILVLMYIRLSKKEEKETLSRFGEQYLAYAALTPAMVPRWSSRKKANKTID